MPTPPPPTLDELHATAARLGVTLVGEPFTTRACLLSPVIHRGTSAILKLTHEPEEMAGPAALQRWNGDGAVRVLQLERHAVVLERGGTTMRQAIARDDSRTTAALCEAIERLHRRCRASGPPPGFVALRAWMRSLFADTDARFEVARRLAARLLEQDREPVLLHGDAHSENFVDGRSRGWLAIDPKGLIGPRAFDYCNLFTNWTLDESLAHFDARLELVVQRAGLERSELLQWIAAWSALSGIWHLEDGVVEAAAYPHAVMAQALSRLGSRER